MIELLQMDFFRNAFIVSIILSFLFGILSFFTVMRNMTFLGAGIAHTAFGGVALGVLLEIDPFLTSLVFCLTASILIGKLSRHGSISMETGIGIFFSLSMALGAIFISLKKDYSFDLMGYLFGNILGVSIADCIIAGAVLAAFLPFVLVFIHRILFMTFDEDVAEISGVKTEMLDTLLLAFLAGIIVISIKVVGIILVSALVVLPASFGMLLSKDYRNVIVFGIIFALVIMTGGLILSYYIDTPAGATIVTAGTAVFFTGFILKKIKS